MRQSEIAGWPRSLANLFIFAKRPRKKEEALGDRRTTRKQAVYASCSDIQESLAATADREDTIGSPQVLLSTSRWLNTDEPCFRKRRYWKEVEDTISPNIAEPHSMNCHLTVRYANNLRGRLEHGCSVSGRERMGLGDTTTNSSHRTSDLECYISA